MTEFKVGDTVRVSRDISKSKYWCGHAFVMNDMRGNCYTIESVDLGRRMVLVNGYMFYPDDLTLIQPNNKSFSESLVSGALCSASPGALSAFDGGKFIGHLVEFLAPDGWKKYAVLDEDGLCVATFKLDHMYRGNNYQFVIQPEKNENA